MIESVYLAGPDVFLPDAEAVGRTKVAMCRRYGFEGLFPLDNAPDVSGGDKVAASARIYRANIGQMRRADAVLANVTPFRGASADTGTAFEIGYFAALERPVFAYSSDPRSFADRTRMLEGLGDEAAADGAGATIEDFDLPDNLMLPAAVEATGGKWVVRASPAGEELAAFAAFEACLEELRAFAQSASRTAATGS